MSLEYANMALPKANNLPIRHVGDVHDGKVRSLYWLTFEDSKRLIEERGYDAWSKSQLGIIITSDDISAYNVNWKGPKGLSGVPFKAESLNEISRYSFERFEKAGLGRNHILEVPHPLVWIVQRAEPVMVEAIGRGYVSGGLERAYFDKGLREFCGNPLPSNLKKNQKLDQLLITPTTKGTLKGIPGIPEEEDVNITRKQIIDNYKALGFKRAGDVDLYEKMLRGGFCIMSEHLESVLQILVDTKFEFGYVRNSDGKWIFIYIDEGVTPDSSRYWDLNEYLKGNIVENSKEYFRKFLLSTFGKEILTNEMYFPERKSIASKYEVPFDVMMNTSKIYREIAEKITGRELPAIGDNPRDDIVEILDSMGLIVK